MPPKKKDGKKAPAPPPDEKPKDDPNAKVTELQRVQSGLIYFIESENIILLIDNAKNKPNYSMKFTWAVLTTRFLDLGMKSRKPRQRRKKLKWLLMICAQTRNG